MTHEHMRRGLGREKQAKVNGLQQQLVREKLTSIGIELQCHLAHMMKV